jgi:dihydrofolate reductase
MCSGAESGADRGKEVYMAAKATRRLRYQVAASLDGYIGSTDGKPDWIPRDPDIDFNAMFAQFDTFLVGRRTFEAMGGHSQSGAMKTVVVSRTLKAADHPGVTVIADGVAEAVKALKAQPGKDIWLFGGGELFRSLASLGLVDRVEVAVVPVLLGAGTPLVPPPLAQTRLKLDGHRLYKKSGIMLLEYTVGT